jgi:hypothetical protein
MRCLLTVFLFSLQAYCFASDSSFLSGTWKASQRGDHYLYIFDKDSNLTIIHGTDTSRAFYSIDTTVNPLHINVRILDRNTSEVLYHSPGIFERIGSDKIRLRLSNNMKDRPSGFLPKGSPDVFLLIRQR